MPPSPPARPLDALSALARLSWSDVPIGELAGVTARAAAAVCGADAALVLERTLGDELVTVCASHGWARVPGRRDLALPHWHGLEALTGDSGAIAVDLGREPAAVGPWVAEGLRSAAAVRIGEAGRPFGVLAVYARRPGA